MNEKIKTMLKKRKIVASSKVVKKKKMHVDSMKFNSMKSMHLKEIVARVIFLRFIYIVACSTMNIMIKDVKTKTIFNNKTKINCMFKRLINVIQLSMRQNINIIMINIINERVHFFNICEAISISIENIIVSIFIFIVKHLNHEIFLNVFFNALLV